MSVLGRSRSPQDSPVPDSPTSSEASSTLGGITEDNAVLFESYLFKIPPLKKSILMKWSKRLFTLRRLDASDPSSIELSYCKDNGSKKEKRHVIDLASIVGIRPTPNFGSADNIFAIETKGRKYVLKAADVHIKNIWLAKLCEYCGQDPVYHITVPNQAPITVYNEAILKLSSDSHVTVVLPSTSETLLSIRFGDVRRMGYADTCNRDVVWFETCKNSQADRFFFFVVPSGIEVAKQIVQELKVKIQIHTSSLLILEDSNVDLSYIAREHYGCTEYPVESRAHILQSGLYRFPSPSYRYFPLVRRDSAPASSTQASDSNVGGVSLEEFGRRKSKTLKGPPPSLTRRPTLDMFVRQGSLSSSFERQTSISSFDRQASTSSFDRSMLRTPSIDRDMTSPSLHELSDGHFSSGSAGDVFDSPLVPHGHIQRKLSVQSSTSSQGSSNSSISHSPATIEEEESPEDSFKFATSTVVVQGRSFSCSGVTSGPTVPPRSVVSLQPAAH